MAEKHSQNISPQGHRPDYSDGILFANTNRKGEADPHYVGRVHIDGVKINLLAWCVTDRAGKQQLILKRKD